MTVLAFHNPFIATMTPVIYPASAIGSTGRVTASDRLEADKAKYVKSPQVIHRRQIPIINSNFTPGLSRKLSSTPSPTEYCFITHNRQTKQQPALQHNESEVYYHSYQSQTSTIARPCSPSDRFEPPANFPHCSLSPSMIRRQANFSHSEKQKIKSPMSPDIHPIHHTSDPQSSATQTVNPHCLRRFSGKKLNRPDSLIIYRQRRDVELTSKENNSNNGDAGLVIRLLQGTPLLRRSIRFSQKSPQSVSQETPVSPAIQKKEEGACLRQKKISYVTNKQEVPFNEQIKFSTSDTQTFFESCGLEGSLLNLLKNYQKSDETPMGSLESMERVSCCLGVADEEIEEKTPVSVIERNARVIKWIYSCNRARTSGEHGDKQISRESTV